jgi:hypothetical protein
MTKKDLEIKRNFHFDLHEVFKVSASPSGYPDSPLTRGRPILDSP